MGFYKSVSHSCWIKKFNDAVIMIFNLSRERVRVHVPDGCVGQSVIPQGYQPCLLTQDLSLAWNSQSTLTGQWALGIFLSFPSQCWDYSAHKPTQWVFCLFCFFLTWFLGVEPSSLCLSDRHFPIDWTISAPPPFSPPPSSGSFSFEPSVALVRLSLYVLCKVRCQYFKLISGLLTPVYTSCLLKEWTRWQELQFVAQREQMCRNWC